MPRGISPYDDAQLQRRLWTPDISRFTTYVTTARRDTLTFATGVSSWRNLGTNGASGDFVQATGASQPAIEYLPGLRHPVLSLTTGHSMAQSGSGVGTSGATTFSLFILASMKASGTRARIWLSATGGNNYLFGWWQGNKARWFDGSAFRASGGADDRLWHMYSSTASSGTGLMWEDGASVSISGSIVNGPGAVSFNTGEPSDSYIAAVAVSAQALGAPEIRRLEGAWMWEFGLQARLVASHPYRNRPPLIGS